MRSNDVWVITIAILLVTYIGQPLVYADDMQDMKAEIAGLKKRLNELETRLQQSDAKAAGLEKSSPETGIPGAITSFAKEIEVHGFVDTSYVFNTNTPVPPNPRTNNLRVFDIEANGFMFNMAEVNFEKPISKESPVGFRIDLDYGQDAKLIHANGLGNAGDEFDLQQGYAQFFVPFTLPFMNVLNFKVGKFVTLHGAEVIESADNWNFSRSYLFGFAIPFTHTGIRAYYKPFENLPIDAYIGIVNGWDNVVDNNKAKTIEGQISYTPTDKLSLSVAGMFGPERFNSNKDFRNLVDVVATYKATDKLTLKVNYDYGWERNGAAYLPSSGTTPAATGLTDQDAIWDGIAGYAKYDIYKWWSVAGRAEYFHDRDGIRTGVLVTNGVPDLELWEVTLTNEFKIFSNLIARLEYRYDKASNQVFTQDKVSANNQSTLSAEMIYKF
ncbi:MAG: porin [Candidatus Omnitrophota bacterium]|nr:porin [Candidatus Omnitrophota bacterium]